MRTKRLLQEMEHIARNVIRSQYISDFTKHDTEKIMEDKAKTPFVWQIRETGTWLYMLSDSDYRKRLLGRMDDYDRLKTENLFFIYNGKDLFPALNFRVYEIALDIEAKLIAHYKPAINKNWHGLDVSHPVSLFDQGLLVKWIPKKKEWKCYYLSNVNPIRFSIGITSEKILEEIFTTGWAKDKLSDFMKNCSSTWEEWIGLPMVYRISDFIGYFGAFDLFGEDYTGGYTAKEICKRFHIKYDKEYEEL